MLLPGGSEGRRFGEAHAHVEPDRYQQRAEKKRNTPAPGVEFGLAEGKRQHQEARRRQQKADRRPQLREHAVPAPFTRRGIFSGQERRATPLATQPQALAETQQAQGRRRPYTQRLVTGQQADQQRAQTHDQ